MRARQVVAAAASIALGGLAACNLIVGSGDYAVGDAGGALPSEDGSLKPDVMTTTMSGDDSGGMTMTTVPDATVPDGGAPEGAAADTGTTTPPSDGGLPALPVGSTVQCGGDGGAGLDAASFQQLVTACVIASSCDPVLFDVPLGQCITEDYLDAFPQVQCLATAKSCDDYMKCTGNRITTAEECDGTAFDDVGTCDSTTNVATNCPASGYGAVYACKVVGGTCAVYSEDSEDTAANCQVAPQCGDTSDGFHCASPTVLYTCESTQNGTIAVGQNCPAMSTCQSDICVYESPVACSTVGRTCDANGDLTACTSEDGGTGGAKFRCSAAGIGCVDDQTQGTICEAPGCANVTCTESCGDDGHTIHTCIGGAPFDVDCNKYGFDYCDQGSDGSGTPYPYCEYF
ncbi:MAG TPA: hypothetical protein VHV30_17545 [Polyangiaceae bacterium]|nr:hypothetical protein [Polyangiaceae bacterium]